MDVRERNERVGILVIMVLVIITFTFGYNAVYEIFYCTKDCGVPTLLAVLATGASAGLVVMFLYKEISTQNQGYIRLEPQKENPKQPDLISSETSSSTEEQA